MNFVLVGDCRSGVGLLADTINSLAGVVCHSGLVGERVDECQVAYERYFGPSDSQYDDPDWYCDGTTNHAYFLNAKIYDRPRHDETSIGVRLDYHTVRRLQMESYLRAKCAEGDFGVVHVTRNPVACFLSKKQAEVSNVSVLRPGASRPPVPEPVQFEANELTAFCRAHLTTRNRIATAVDDILEVSYADILANWALTIERVVDFIELPDLPHPVQPARRRLPNVTPLQRLLGLDRVRKELPSDVRALLDADDLV
jgi:hypothetical protein